MEGLSCTLTVLLSSREGNKMVYCGFENVGYPIPGRLKTICCAKVFQAELGEWHLFRLALQ